MNLPSEKEVKKQEETINRIVDCYRYLYENADEEILRNKIKELSKEHLLSKVKEMHYSVELPLRNVMKQLMDEKTAKDKEKKS